MNLSALIAAAVCAALAWLYWIERQESDSYGLSVFWATGWTVLAIVLVVGAFTWT